MKTTTKIFGNVSLALIGVGTIFKLLHWPGASVLLVLGFLLLGLIFFPATILASYRKNGRKNLFLHILPILGGIALMFGILFKIQHWPGAAMLLIIGWVILLIIFLPIWLIVKITQSKNKKETLIYTTGVLGVIIFELSTLFKIQHWPGASIMIIVGAILIVSVFLPLYSTNLYKKTEFVNGRFIFLIIGISFFLMYGALLSINLEKKVWSSVSYTDYYAQIEKEYFTQQNTKLLKRLNTENNSLLEIQNQANKISDLITEIQKDLIIASNHISDDEVEKYLNNIDLISDKGQNNVVNQLFFSEQGDGYAIQLKQNLLDYKSNLLNVLGQNPEYKKEIDHLFMLDDNKDEILVTWEDRAFKYNSLYTTLINLTNIDRNIHLAEHLAICYYKDNNVEEETSK